MKNLVLSALIISLAMVMNPNKTLAQEFHAGSNPPTYTGGNKALKEFIENNLIYPDTIKKAGISGTVMVRLLINEDGKVESVKLMRGINEVCDSEAIRVARLSDGWQAATKWEKPVSHHVLLPIEFRCENSVSNSQPVMVAGEVTDKSTGKPIEGALILIKGTNVGTLTDQRGSYQLEIPGENFDLEISSLGFIAVMEPIGKSRTINVELDTDYYLINFDLEN